MPLISTDFCPACRETILLRWEKGAYVCPACACRFRRNWAKWLVGIPGCAAIVLAAKWIFHIAPVNVAFIVPLLVGLVVVGIPNYRIVRTAASDDGEGSDEKAIAEMVARRKTRWFLWLIGIVILANLGLLAAVLMGYF